MEHIKNIDLYLLLEITQEATKSDIKKAYRKKALQCHPDKNPDIPNAAQLFHQLQQALAILTDDSSRKAYDNVLKARKANELRNRKLDDRRKRFKQQLETSELEFTRLSKEKLHNTKTDEEKLAKEVERVMEEGLKELVEERKIIQDQIIKDGKGTINIISNSEHAVGNTKIKIRWKAPSNWYQNDHNSYTAKSLYEIFNKYGDVNAVVLSKSSTARKGSAIVEMDLGCCAEMAVKTEKGFTENPLQAKLIFDSAIRQKASSQSTNEYLANHIPPLQQKSKPLEFESLEMRKIRQAEERRWLENVMIEEDKLNQ